MFWNRFRRSVRSRMVFWYVSLSCAILLLASVLILLCSWRHLSEKYQKEPNVLLDELIYEYLSGHEGVGGFVRCAPSDIPSFSLPGQPLFAYSRMEKREFIAFVQADEGYMEYRLDGEGVILNARVCHVGDTKFLSHIFSEKGFDLGMGNIYLMLMDASGKVLAKTVMDPHIQKKMVSRNLHHRLAYRLREQEMAKAKRYVSIRVNSVQFPDGNILSVGKNVTEDERFLILLAIYLGGAFLLSLILGIGVAVYLANRFTSSLEKISATAVAISHGDLTRRVAIGDEGVEIALLSHAFNTMCDKNEKTMNELRTLSDDIAHDLRTPLTRMRGNAELAATGGVSRECLAERVSEECASMLDMINTMLEISRAGCGIERMPKERIDLGLFLKRAADLYSAIAEDHQQRLFVRVPVDPVWFEGHKSKLQQLIGNLLDNALKFTPAGGEISLSLTKTDRWIWLEVADTGVGVEEKDRPHIFQRFYRSDTSRTLPGSGLGLALVHAIVTSYGGNIRYEAREPVGSIFRVRLPHA